MPVLIFKIDIIKTMAIFHALEENLAALTAFPEQPETKWAWRPYRAERGEDGD